jgi:hypothetical protein
VHPSGKVSHVKVDGWELANLMRLLALFVPKAAIQFETQLRAALQKHGIER